ncbi:MAG: hypothetical protein KAT05_15480 [Spirochaetes bacterium]|nr:hypothetical protein [Spirochaetota bacterium]
MTRLGYRHTINIGKKQEDKIKSVIDIAAAYCKLKAVYIRLNILKKNQKNIEIENKIIWNSKSIVKFLINCQEIFLVGVTSGNEIIEYRDKLMKEDDLFSSVIIDAVGSEMTEAMAQWVHDFLNKLIQKEGKTLTKRRFSPGYGDMALSNQMSVYDLLELNKIGIDLLPNYILVPEKSITAIIGIE